MLIIQPVVERWVFWIDASEVIGSGVSVAVGRDAVECIHVCEYPCVPQNSYIYIYIYICMCVCVCITKGRKKGRKLNVQLPCHYKFRTHSLWILT